MNMTGYKHIMEDGYKDAGHTVIRLYRHRVIHVDKDVRSLAISDFGYSFGELRGGGGEP